jgi:hypothetical protein
MTPRGPAHPVAVAGQRVFEDMARPIALLGPQAVEAVED